MTKLCARGKAAAKRKFAVYPSAYANAYASKICAGKIKDPSGKKKKDWGPKKARLGAMIKIGKDLLKKKGIKKGKKTGPNMAASKTPITKDVNVNKTGSSSLSGNELKIRGKKANYVVNRDSKELKEIPVNKSKRKYKKGGLNKWFKEKWVDISSKKPGGGYRECGRKSASRSKRGYPKCVPAAKAASMTKGQIRSAVARKRSTPNTGPKPTNVKTIIKKRTGGFIGSYYKGMI